MTNEEINALVDSIRLLKQALSVCDNPMQSIEYQKSIDLIEQKLSNENNW